MINLNKFELFFTSSVPKMISINKDDIARFLEEIPDDGDIISGNGDFYVQENEDLISPLDFDGNLDTVQANVDIDLDSCGCFFFL